MTLALLIIASVLLAAPFVMDRLFGKQRQTR